MEETVRFWWQLDHIMLGLGQSWGYSTAGTETDPAKYSTVRRRMCIIQHTHTAFQRPFVQVNLGQPVAPLILLLHLFLDCTSFWDIFLSIIQQLFHVNNFVTAALAEVDFLTYYAIVLGALVAVWQSAGFAIGRLQVRISAWATSHQGLLSIPSLRGR